MLYAFVRPLAAITLKVFFRKIYLSNLHRIPKDKPVILAANHPSAFIEPCILACFLDRPIHFLVRGDLFVKPFYIKILRALQMVPVYRLKDGGYQNLKNNYATFEYCYATLKEKKTIMILAEGNTIHEKRLRPLQKGTARIVFGAYDSFPDMDEVYVVPVGVNYTFADRARSEAMIDFGEAIPTRQYWKTGETNASQAISDLTEELRKRLTERVIIIERKEDEVLTEQLFELYRSENPAPHWPEILNDPQRLFSEKAIADFVNQMKPADRNALKAQTDAYFAKLDQSGITDQGLTEKKAPGWRAPLLLLGFVPFIIGFVWNYPPLRLAKFIVDTRVRSIEFYSSVRIAAGLVLYLIYVPLWLVFAIEWWGWESGLFGVLGALLCGYFALIYSDVYKEWLAKQKTRKLSTEQKKELLNTREIIWQGVASCLPDLDDSASFAPSSSI